MAKKKKQKGVNIDEIMEKFKDLPEERQRQIAKEMIIDDTGLFPVTPGMMMFSTDRIKYVYPADRVKTIEVAEEMFLSNPLVKWYVNMVVSFVVGGGMEVVYGEDPLLGALINRFNKINEMDYMLSKFQRADVLHGEGFYRLFYAKKDGAKPGLKENDILLRRMATDIVKIDFNPADPQDIYKFVINWYDQATRQFVEESILPVLRFFDKNAITDDEIVETPAKRKRKVTRGDSCVIQFKMNDLPNQIHGTSDIKVLIEWASLFLEHVRTGVLQSKLRGGGCYAITIKTSDPKVFDAEAAKYATWTIGDNFTVNENVEVDTLEFTSPIEGFEDIRRALLLTFITGTGFSEHYTGDSSSGSRAQGQTMELPQMKGIEDRQADVVWLLTNIYRTALTLQLKHGMPKDILKDNLNADPEKSLDLLWDDNVFGIKLPDVSKRDRTRIVENLAKEMNELGTISIHTASKELGRDYEQEQRYKKKEIPVVPKNKDKDIDKKVNKGEGEQTDEPPEESEDGSADAVDRRDSKK